MTQDCTGVLPGVLPDSGETEDATPPTETCLAVTAALRRNYGAGSGEDSGFAPLAPWGVQLAGNFSKALALAAFERARTRYAAIVD